MDPTPRPPSVERERDALADLWAPLRPFLITAAASLPVHRPDRADDEGLFSAPTAHGPARVSRGDLDRLLQTAMALDAGCPYTADILAVAAARAAVVEAWANVWPTADAFAALDAAIETAMDNARKART